MAEPQNINVTITTADKKTPVLGILSLCFAGASMIPFMGILSIPGLILGIIATVKRQFSTGIIGIVLSVVMMILSPTVWALFSAPKAVSTAQQLQQMKSGNNLVSTTPSATSASPSNTVIQGPAHITFSPSGTPTAVPAQSPLDNNSPAHP